MDLLEPNSGERDDDNVIFNFIDDCNEEAGMMQLQAEVACLYPADGINYFIISNPEVLGEYEQSSQNRQSARYPC